MPPWSAGADRGWKRCCILTVVDEQFGPGTGRPAPGTLPADPQQGVGRARDDVLEFTDLDRRPCVAHCPRDCRSVICAAVMTESLRPPMKLLVTGGAGYIGSIVARPAAGGRPPGGRAGQSGARPSSGGARPGPAGRGRPPRSGGGRAALADGFDGVLHFAAFALVGESVEPSRACITETTWSGRSTCWRRWSLPRFRGSSSPRPARSTGSPTRCRSARTRRRGRPILRRLEAGRGRDDRRLLPALTASAQSACATSTSPAPAARRARTTTPRPT